VNRTDRAEFEVLLKVSPLGRKLWARVVELEDKVELDAQENAQFKLDLILFINTGSVFSGPCAMGACMPVAEEQVEEVNDNDIIG